MTERDSGPARAVDTIGMADAFCGTSTIEGPMNAAPASTTAPVRSPAPLIDADDVIHLARILAPVEDADDKARRILDSLGGTDGLVVAPVARLVSAGLSASEGERVHAALQLALRAVASAPAHRRIDRAACVSLLRPLLQPLRHEEMHAIFLAHDGTFLGRRMLAMGGAEAVCLHVRDVLGPALEARAPRLVLAHNHPSGRCHPSPEDAALSDRVSRAADIVGIRLVDHLVFARDGVASAMPDGARWGPPPRIH